MIQKREYYVSDCVVEEPITLTTRNDVDETNAPDILVRMIEIEGVIRINADLNLISVSIDDSNRDFDLILNDIEEILEIQEDFCDLESLGIRGSESVAIMY